MTALSTTSVFVHDFREAAPYIDYLRGKTLVIGIASSLLQETVLRSLAADIHLLASLGVRLVLVHGSSSQITALAQAAGNTPHYHDGCRITDDETLVWVKQACGMLRCELEAALSVGMVQSPQRGKRLRLVSGNFVSARPYGIIQGIDMGHTGRVRKVDAEALHQVLQTGAVVLMSPMGTSLSGQIFNLSMTDIAEAVAIALGAEKLIFLVEQAGILDEQGKLLPNLSAAEAETLLNHHQVSAKQRRLLQAAIYAVQNQVQRCQILSGYQDGGLISELFTRKGTGTSIAQAPFMRIRLANTGDIADITTLIRPLEQTGVLLKRSREYLENHIGEFFVLEHDRQIYGCVALKIFADQQVAELACLVVSPEARDGGYGECLLKHVIQTSQQHGLHTLFALSTHTGDWFLERGFQLVSAETLPPQRLQEYHASERRSKIFRLALNGSAHGTIHQA